jgi:hypothetical protein
MSDLAESTTEQRRTPRPAELQVVQFIGAALRAGERAILVTGRGPGPVRVPEAALEAPAEADVHVVRIEPPLPEPPELQEMIGAATAIAGGRDMTPQAMARLLLFTDPKPTVILAIDDAHTLSRRSLGYLTLMTELLAPEAPILQLVLAAAPALLDTLAQPEFERLRNWLSRPAFETFGGSAGGRANETFQGLRKPSPGRVEPGLALLHYPDRMAASPPNQGAAGPAIYAAGGLVAIGCVAVIAYLAYSAFTVDAPFPPIRTLNPMATDRLSEPGGGNRAAQSPDTGAPPPSAAANPGAETPQVRVAEAAPVAPDVSTAPSAEEPAAGKGDRAAESSAAPPPSAAPIPSAGAPPTRVAEATPAAPDVPTAPSAEEPAAGKGDRTAHSPDAGVPPPSAAPIPSVETPPARMAEATPTAANETALREVAALPTLAPVHVILDVPRDEASRDRRSADIRRALTAAGLDVSDLAPVAHRRQVPSIGYYFESDREAAAKVGRLLAPLLGAVEPVALPKRGSLPEPGAVEVAIP